MTIFTEYTKIADIQQSGYEGLWIRQITWPGRSPELYSGNFIRQTSDSERWERKKRIWKIMYLFLYLYPEREFPPERPTRNSSSLVDFFFWCNVNSFSLLLVRSGGHARTTDSEFEFISRFFLLMQCQYIFFTACSVGRVTRKIYNWSVLRNLLPAAVFKYLSLFNASSRVSYSSTCTILHGRPWTVDLHFPWLCCLRRNSIFSVEPL